MVLMVMMIVMLVGRMEVPSSHVALHVVVVVAGGGEMKLLHG